jgi:hypothetical protein
VPKKVPDPADRERVLRVLREIVDAPAGTGSQAARYAAAQKLARLTGLDVGPEPEIEKGDEQAPDPFEFLDEMEYRRRKRARR